MIGKCLRRLIEYIEQNMTKIHRPKYNLLKKYIDQNIISKTNT